MNIAINPYSLCAFIFNFITFYAYFSKENVKTTETKLYSVLLISSLVGTILSFFTYVIVLNYQNVSSILLFVPRLYLIYLIVWGTALTDYVLYISLVKSIKDKKKWKIINNILIGVSLIFIILSLLLPMECVSANNMVYTTGSAVNCVYFLAFIYAIVMILGIILNIKNIVNKKYIPIVSFLLLAIIVVYVQYKFPYLLIITLLITVTTVLMYYTIENPDVKMLNELTLTKNELEKANNVKREFISSMSHEIKTPLNAIVGFSSLTKEVDNLNDAKENADDIIKASNELIEMFDKMNEVFVLENSIEQIKIEAYDPINEFESVLDLYEEKLNKKNIKLIKEVEYIPLLKGDKNILKKILINVLDNAYKYTNKGSVTFRASYQDEFLNIEIEDTGVGIKKEDLENIFEPFVKTSVTKNSDKRGMGLGLSITKSLVELLNGSIKLESIYNKGTTVIITLKQEEVI